MLRDFLVLRGLYKKVNPSSSYRSRTRLALFDLTWAFPFSPPDYARVQSRLNRLQHDITFATPIPRPKG